MKRTTIILLSLLALFPAGCVKDDRADTRTISDIHWNVVCESSPLTRAASVLSQDADFATCVWALGEGKHWSIQADRNTAVLQLASPGSYYSGIVKYDPSILKWKIPGKKLYWPETGTYTFFSFTVANFTTSSLAPSFEALSSSAKAKFSTSPEGVNITGWSTDTPDGYRDILIADIKTERTSASGYLGMDGVPTEFKHALSQVEFHFLKSNQEINFPDGDIDGTTIRLKKVALRNFWHSANLIAGSTLSQRWEFAETAAAKASSIHESLTLFDSSIDGEKVLSTSDASLSTYGNLYLPQDLYDKSRNYGAHVHDTASSLTETALEIGYSVQLRDQSEGALKTVIISFPNDIEHNIWNKSTKYVYEFRIGAKAVPIEFDADISPWMVGILNNNGVIEL